MNTDVYKTIAAPAQGAYKEKGSKFTAYAYPISSVDEVKPLVDSLRAEFYDARHHCYAYRLGQHGEQWRAVDDGEPSGTAGRPILGQLMSAEVTNLLVVVVRYFGGTKLGVSGLITAYKDATADALANARIVERTVDDEFELRFDYLVMNDVMRLIKEMEPQILEQQFDNMCSIRVSIRRDNSSEFVAKAQKIDTLQITQTDT